VTHARREAIRAAIALAPTSRDAPMTSPLFDNPVAPLAKRAMGRRTAKAVAGRARSRPTPKMNLHTRWADHNPGNDRLATHSNHCGQDSLTVPNCDGERCRVLRS
jgi:hypothetical protein